jgi:hypothetical protein
LLKLHLNFKLKYKINDPKEKILIFNLSHAKKDSKNLERHSL